MVKVKASPITTLQVRYKLFCKVVKICFHASWVIVLNLSVMIIDRWLINMGCTILQYKLNFANMYLKQQNKFEPYIQFQYLTFSFKFYAVMEVKCPLKGTHDSCQHKVCQGLPDISEWMNSKLQMTETIKTNDRNTKHKWTNGPPLGMLARISKKLIILNLWLVKW